MPLFVKPDKFVAINGYDGDKLTRVILVAEVYPNRVLGLDSTRNQWRCYSLSKIGSISEVKE